MPTQILNQHFSDEEIAQAAHNLNTSIRRSDGDILPFWHELEENAWQRADTLRQVRLLRQNPEFTAERDHENWRAERLAAGWSYGPQRDDDAKKNPLLVRWNELPFKFRARGLAAFRVIRTMLGYD